MSGSFDQTLTDARRVVDAELLRAPVVADVPDLLDRLGLEVHEGDDADLGGHLASGATGPLALAIDDARALVDAELAAHRASPPPLRDGSNRRRRPTAVAAMAVAAIALLAVGVASVLAAALAPARPSLAERISASSPSTPTRPIAPARTTNPDDPSAAHDPNLASDATGTGFTAWPRGLKLDPVEAPGAVPPLDPQRATPTGQRLGVAADARHRTGATTGSSSASSLAALDAEAQRAWRSGDTRRARELFRKIIELGGRTTWAEQAFGELLTLERELDSNGATRDRTRRRYLRRFPEGRYADSVRAELCRGAKLERREACWRDYVKHHPKGAHRAEADGIFGR